MRSGILFSNKRATMIVIVLLTVAAVARAQPSGCTYERCALRVEADPNVPFGSRLVQGVEAKPVATLGLLIPRIPMLESSAGAMIASGVVFASTEPTVRRRYVVPAVTLDLALGVAALVEGVRAHNALDAAIERYNTALRPPIFRQVSFPPFDAITLGEPLSQRAPPSVPIGVRRAVFRQRLGDTDSIFVEWDADKRVRLLEFLYPTTKSVSKAVEDYEAVIGVGEQHAVADSAGQRLERWSWKDQATTFEFSSLAVGDKLTRVWSILRDRTGS